MGWTCSGLMPSWTAAAISARTDWRPHQDMRGGKMMNKDRCPKDLRAEISARLQYTNDSRTLHVYGCRRRCA